MILLLCAATVASTASLVAGLRHALSRHRRTDDAPVVHDDERRRLRAALKDMIVDVDLDAWPAHLRPTADMPDRDTLRRSLPRSNRPAWIDIREDRDGRG